MTARETILRLAGFWWTSGARHQALARNGRIWGRVEETGPYLDMLGWVGAARPDWQIVWYPSLAIAQRLVEERALAQLEQEGKKGNS